MPKNLLRIFCYVWAISYYITALRFTYPSLLTIIRVLLPRSAICGGGNGCGLTNVIQTANHSTIVFLKHIYFLEKKKFVHNQHLQVFFSFFTVAHQRQLYATNKPALSAHDTKQLLLQHLLIKIMSINRRRPLVIISGERTIIASCMSRC